MSRGMSSKKIFFAAMLALAIILSATAGILPLSANSEEAFTYGGSWGNDIRWEYDSKTETLSFTGTGRMKETYYDSDLPDLPWNSFMSSVRTVIIGSDITWICDYAFLNCKKLENVIFDEGSKLEEIGSLTFLLCENLKSIEIPASVKSIGNRAFFDCDSLETVTFAEGSILKSISNEAFAYCAELKSVEIPPSVESIARNVFYDSQSTVIKCKEGSVAHKYAKDNGISFILDHSPIGEAISNGDGTHRQMCTCGEEHSAKCTVTEATHLTPAMCEVCLAVYGEADKDAHIFSDKLTAGETTHYYECICGEKKDEAEHAFAFGSPNNDGTHNLVCTCGKVKNEACSGGEATCMNFPRCGICNAEYGDYAKHYFESMVCNKTEHWRSCALCGSVSETEVHEFGNGGVCLICTFEWKQLVEPETDSEILTETENETGTEHTDSADIQESSTDNEASETLTGGQSTGGCRSSTGGGAVIFSAIAVCGVLLKRKK